MPGPRSLAEIEAMVKGQLSTEIGSEKDSVDPFVSGSFKEFQSEEKDARALKTFYEKYCDFARQYINFIKPTKSMESEIQEDLNISYMNTDPQGVVSASIFTLFLSLLIALPLFIFFKDAAFFTLFVGFFLAYICYTYPNYYAEIIKIQAQQESILAALYMTIYMRLNPVLENAIYFAVQHLTGPLGKDLKTLLWLLDTEKVNTIEEGMNKFVDLWVIRNPDFVKAMLTLHTILSQPDKTNQERILDKALNDIMTSTYEKMKHYSNDLKMPVLLVNTFGLMLPLIGLIAFPMLSIFMADAVNVSYIFFGYIVILPSIIFFFTRRILSKRPGAFSVPDLSNNPTLPPPGKFVFEYEQSKYYIPILPVSAIIGFIITIPGLIHVITKTIPAWNMAQSINPGEAVVPCSEYGISAMVLATTIPLGLAIGTSLFFYLRSVQKIKIRDTIVEIEEDLGPSIFQLSNQFTENIPVEVAISNFVSEYQMLNLKKKSIFFFFSDIFDKMQDEGMTFVNAIFDPTRGVLIKYPSVLLKEIVWVMVEGAKKGSLVLYNVVVKVSTYLENTKKIKELIYDLLHETVSSINMQATFLAPFLAGLVGSLTLIIVRSLYQMMKQLQQIMKLIDIVGGSGGANAFDSFINFTKITPPTVFQVLVGVYTVESVILLSILSNGVENGFDNTSRDMRIAKNLFTAMCVYVIVNIIGILALQMLINQGVAGAQDICK